MIKVPERPATHRAWESTGDPGHLRSFSEESWVAWSRITGRWPEMLAVLFWKWMSGLLLVWQDRLSYRMGPSRLADRCTAVQIRRSLECLLCHRVHETAGGNAEALVVRRKRQVQGFPDRDQLGLIVVSSLGHAFTSMRPWGWSRAWPSSPVGAALRDDFRHRFLSDFWEIRAAS